MSRVERALGALVSWNNEQVRKHAKDRFAANPRPPGSERWVTTLEATTSAIQREWHAFTTSGGSVPRIEELLDESQGNDGDWRAGLLVSRGRPATRLATRFPDTIAALEGVPGLWSALWSVLEPGTELPPHTGPNAGMLRFHLGVDCGESAALQVGDRITPYVDGVGILFDDTAEHAAWNRGDAPRVTLFLEVLRPIAGPTRWTNLATQRMLALDPRYRRAASRADEWDLARSEANP